MDLGDSDVLDSDSVEGGTEDLTPSGRRGSSSGAGVSVRDKECFSSDHGDGSIGPVYSEGDRHVGRDRD